MKFCLLKIYFDKKFLTQIPPLSQTTQHQKNMPEEVRQSGQQSRRIGWGSGYNVSHAQVKDNFVCLCFNPQFDKNHSLLNRPCQQICPQTVVLESFQQCNKFEKVEVGSYYINPYHSEEVPRSQL